MIGPLATALGDVDTTVEEGRAFYQRRLGQYSLALALCSVGYHVAVAPIFALTDHLHVIGLIGQGALRSFSWRALLLTQGRIAMLGVLLLGLAVWLICRARAAQSMRVLRMLDAAFLVIGVVCASAAAVTWDSHGPSTFWLAAVVLRSAMVPDTPRRALVLSSLAFVPAAMSAQLTIRLFPHNIGAGPVMRRLLLSASAALPALAVVYVLSRTVYRLRTEVADAARAGQYALGETLGAGAMGTVYRARHHLLRRPTAVKVMRGDVVGSDYAQFEREALATSELSHPSTVTLYDFGRTSDGGFYYAMELVEGPTLQQLVEREGPQPPARVVNILRQASASLAEAHEAGLIHRDVKPGNLMLCQRGGIDDFVKVLDFGLVRAAGHSDDSSVAGTPLYMAPERLLAPETIDARADIYALGAVGWFLLVGRPLWLADDKMQILEHQLHSEPAAPRELLDAPPPARLERLIMRCLAKDPATRPRDGRELERLLSKLDVADRETIGV